MDSVPERSLQISPSRIKTYIQCPKKYDYIYTKELVPKVVERKGYFDKGNYIHELLHAYYNRVRSGWEPGSDLILSAMQRRMQDDFSKLPQTTQLLNIYASVVSIVNKYIKIQSPSLDK